MILGGAIAWRSGVLLAYVAGFWLLCHVCVVGLEEKFLRRRFSAEFEAYRPRCPAGCRACGRGPSASE